MLVNDGVKSTQFFRLYPFFPFSVVIYNFNFLIHNERIIEVLRALTFPRSEMAEFIYTQLFYTLV